jgi:hypothetical protein
LAQMKDFIVILVFWSHHVAHSPFYEKIVALAVESFLSIENNSIQLKWTYGTKPTGPWVNQHLESYHDKHSNFFALVCNIYKSPVLRLNQDLSLSLSKI